ncbi:hypothetical protein TNCV_4432571 [Trichonephila clavipes]|nr:hypothetical protein TNCV_4432571 [Trichonephila clavipes]
MSVVCVPCKNCFTKYLFGALVLRTGKDQFKVFSLKLGKKPKETNAMLVRVYEDQALSMKYVYEWFTRFRDGRENVLDNPRSERPTPSDSIHGQVMMMMTTTMTTPELAPFSPNYYTTTTEEPSPSIVFTNNSPQNMCPQK